ncbi:MAG: hypothetical protein BGO98_31900 [Myxococcales bacterium 68-20]|nr:MAG: hypothetical protein BGO98_31900 [Myxococcales bacterium 68-20]
MRSVRKFTSQRKLESGHVVYPVGHSSDGQYWVSPLAASGASASGDANVGGAASTFSATVTRSPQPLKRDVSGMKTNSGAMQRAMRRDISNLWVRGRVRAARATAAIA